jgi:predicted regulator of Ras-like GTPase activity (Roadblock/LC7/MglB family)
MSEGFSPVLAALTRLHGVRSSLLISESDGIIVDVNVRIGERGDRVAALAASLYRKSRLASRAAGLGAAVFMQLEAARGRVCAAGKGDLVLIVVTEPTANVGMIRVELLKAAGTLP